MLKKHYSYSFNFLLAAFLLTATTAISEENTSVITEESKPSVEEKIKQGKALFNNFCKHCHFITYEESSIGSPGLRGVLERHDEEWLHQWIKNPTAFAKINVTARDLIDNNKFRLAMPTFPVMQDDKLRSAIIEYLKTLK